MTFTPDDLKRAAAAQREEMASRVNGRQGGVATYFDVLLSRILKRLEDSESLHGWNTENMAVAHAVRGRRESAAAGLDRLFSGISRRLGFKSRHGSNANTEKSLRTESARELAELRWLASYLKNQGEGRFVPYEVRLRGDEAGQQSDIRSPERAMSQGTAACLTWKGAPLFKSVFDFAILPMLLWELKPATVFEIGSGTGTSARWIADLLKGFGLSSQVYSTDIKPIGEPYPGVHFLAGDCRSPATLFEADLLRSAPRPYLVIEDAHVNAHDMFLYIDDFLMKGDYFLIEDSLPKGDDLNRFLTGRPHRYLVDTHYTDYFGRNATSAINSILIRV